MIDYNDYALKICESEINRRKFIKPDDVHWVLWSTNKELYLRDYMKDVSSRIKAHMENLQTQIMGDKDLDVPDKGKYFRDINDGVVNRLRKYERELKENPQ